MIDLEKSKQIILKDDDTPTGGIAFIGETLYDFIMSQDKKHQEILTNSDDIRFINNCLKECGIMPISLCEFHKVYKISDEIRQRQLSIYESLKKSFVPYTKDEIKQYPKSTFTWMTIDELKEKDLKELKKIDNK